ncbi:MAG: FlgD immunoglobulin-like domain containing protein [Steroidobacteraceae bacterium]
MQGDTLSRWGLMLVVALGFASTSVRAQVYPFIGGTHVSFLAVRAGAARWDLFDVRGRRVRTVLAPGLGAGSHTLWWDGRDASGRPVEVGTYFYRLQVPGEASHRGKLVRTK